MSPSITAGVDTHDLSEQLTRIARQVMPLALAKGLGFFFDYRGPSFVTDVSGDQIEAIALPLLMEAVNTLSVGFIFFSVDVRAHPSGQAAVMLQVAQTETPSCELTMRSVLAASRSEAMAGHDPASSAHAAVLQQVRQCCERLSGSLNTHKLVGEGQVTQAYFTLPCPPYPTDLTNAMNQGLVAWLIGSPSILYEASVRRLHRLGWSVKIFPTIAAAQAQLARVSSSGLPHAVIGATKCQVSVADLTAFSAKLPPATSVIATHLSNSDIHTDASGFAGCVQVMTEPLSPKQMHQMTVVALAKVNKKMRMPRDGGFVMERRPRALLVEDNRINQLLSTEILNLFGFDVDIANNGQEAIDSCLQDLPAIIIMDLDMPVMNGLDATREIRALERKGRLPYIPIIAATAHAGEENRWAAERSGMDAFTTKPLDVNLLRSEIQRLLAKTSTISANQPQQASARYA